MGRIGYEPALDGLRGLAIAAIMGYHAELTIARGAFLGVSTFFTLSGFLITTLLVLEYERTGRIALWEFYRRRLRRLMPAALLCLAGIALFGVLFASATQLQGMRGDGLWALFYGANWRFIATGQSYANLFVDPSPVRHFWSLAIEEQFYLIFPLVSVALLAIGRGSRKVLLAGCGLLALASVVGTAYFHHPGDPLIRFYYGTDARAAELLVGCVLAVVLTGRWPFESRAVRVAMGAIGTGALALTFVLWVGADINGDGWYEGGLGLYSLATAAVIVACITPGNPARWLLAAWPLRELGRISYGAYLFHWPVFLVLNEARTGLSQWPLFALRVAVTLSIAVLSFRFVEAPIRRGTFWFPVRPTAVAVGAIALVAASLVLVTRDPPAPDLVLVTPADLGPPPAPPADRPAPTLPVTPPATPVPFPAPARVLVLGDSIAWSLGLGFSHWADETGQATVANRAQIGCGLATGGESTLHQNPCEDFRTLYPPLIEQFRPDVVVMMTGVWDVADRRLGGRSELSSPGDPEFDRWMLGQYQEVVDLITAEGAGVVWLSAPCIEETDRAGTFAGSSVFEPERIEHVNDVIIPRLAVANSDTVQTIDISDEICPGGHFAADLYGVVGARPDGLHFTDVGATAFCRWLCPQLLTWPPSPPPS